MGQDSRASWTLLLPSTSEGTREKSPRNAEAGLSGLPGPLAGGRWHPPPRLLTGAPSRSQSRATCACRGRAPSTHRP